MMNKRGLSNIVATVLIVLLALAAVAIVWGFLRPTFNRAASQTSLSAACFDIQLDATQCKLSGSTATVAYQLKSQKGLLDSVIVAVEDSTGVTKTASGTAAPVPTGAMDSKTATVDTTGMTPNYVARVAAVVTDGNEKQTCHESVEVACTA